jgi:competence protein ComEC
MPLLVHVVASWLAGLWIGQTTGTVVPLVVAALLGTALALWQRAPRTLAASGMLAAGLLVASVAQAERLRCRTALRDALNHGGAARLTAEPASAGRASAGRASAGREPTAKVLVRGTLRASVGRCAVGVTVRWKSTPPPEGHALAVRGQAQVTPRGLALRDVDVLHVGDRDLLRASRAWAAHTIDTLFGARAPLVRALLIADQDGIPATLRDRYADAGLVHVLSVSGMHVAIIASALLTLGSLLRVSRRHTELFAMAAVILYVVTLGCPPPAVRSAVMLVVMALATRWQRPLHDWTALALGAVVPTVDPLVVTDLGWQLSVGGMAALVAARALKRSWRQWAVRVRDAALAPPERLAHWLITRRGIGEWFVSEISTGVVATVVTAPLIAWTFGRLSLVAPLSNIAAAPVIAVLQPALFLALLLAPVPPLAGMVADASQPAMALLDWIADVAGAPAWAVLPVAPSLVAVGGAGVAMALIVRGTAARRRTPWLLAAVVALVLAIWLPVLRGGSGAFEMHVIDVGQGDAIALRTPRGRWVVVDAGPRWEGGDAAVRAVIPHLRRLGGPVALFVLSHAHDDHAGGAASLVQLFKPALWWEPAFISPSPGYRAALAAVRDRGVIWQRARPGNQWRLDGVTVTVLAPDSTWTAAQTDANETSVVLRVDYGAHRFLLTGDAEREEEAWLLAHYPPDALRADILKLGHHGSRTSSSAPLLDAVQPRVGIASAGTGNRYGHPAPETLANFVARRIPVLRTDLEGTVIVRSDGRQLEIETSRERWLVPPRDSA